VANIKINTMITQIELRDKVVNVEYKFHRGECEVRNCGDGSGYPGDGAYVGISKIVSPTGVDHSLLIYNKFKKLAAWIESQVLEEELRFV
jgi:hypothetical protein